MDTFVCKFGGTSLADAAQIRKVRDIVRADARRRFVVVSAPGKRDAGDQKITDLLLTCWHLAGQNLDFAQPLSLIRERYTHIARDLEIEPLLYPIDEAQTELEKLARGESFARHARLDGGARRVLPGVGGGALSRRAVRAVGRVHSL